jgi:hypothetical protein
MKLVLQIALGIALAPIAALFLCTGTCASCAAIGGATQHSSVPTHTAVVQARR